MKRATMIYKEYIVGDIFTVSACKRIPINAAKKYTESTTLCPLISGTTIHNGLSGYYYIQPAYKSNIISVGHKTAFYQPVSYTNSLGMMYMDNINLNLYNGLYIVTVLNKRKVLYNFYYARVTERLKHETISLPSILVDGVYTPD